MAKPKKLTTFKSTTDNWYLNFLNDRVEVSLFLNERDIGSDGSSYIWHRVCVWGEDDMGMEKDFFGKETGEQAESLYNQIINLPEVNRDDMKALGLVDA